MSPEQKAKLGISCTAWVVQKEKGTDDWRYGELTIKAGQVVGVQWSDYNCKELMPHRIAEEVGIHILGGDPIAKL